MRKKICLLTVGLCGLFLLTGCENPISNFLEKDENSNYIKYGMHYYDNEAHHTEEVELYYDKDGNFKKAELYYVWDSSQQKSCKGFTNYEDEYPGAVYKCIEIEGGKVKLYVSVTDESIEAGAFDNGNYNVFDVYYDDCKTEKDAKAFFEQVLETMKNSSTHSDEQNYLIIANERVEW